MKGYNPDFLEGVTLPLPHFSPQLEGLVLYRPELKEGIIADYLNYSVITNEEQRSPVLAAVNLDQNKLKSTGRSDDWKIDSRIGEEYQLNNDYYRSNPWDRGHLARRVTVAWGETSREGQKAADESFYFSNATLQHMNFNQDEWLALEDWVLNLTEDSDGKITVFCGPIWGDFSRTIRPPGREAAIIPSAFFKIVCFINKDTGKLDVRAFIMYQDEEALKGKSGRKTFNNQTYQVTISEIEALTGLEFADEIYEQNPLYYNENSEAKENLNISHFPERIEVSSSNEVVGKDDERTYFSDDDIEVYLAAAQVNAKGNERKNEWISILNLTDQVYDFSDWTLSDGKRKPLRIGDAVDAKNVAPGHALVVNPLTPLQLANKGGIIELFDDQGHRVDRAVYTADDIRSEGFPVNFALGKTKYYS